MNHSHHHITGSVLVLALTAVAAAQPAITEINDTDYAPSSRVAITGSGFGADGQVVIAGIAAWTTTWTDTRIVTYVPEAAPLGPASLHVVAGGEQSNAVSLTVTARQPVGRVRWIFETDGDQVRWRPAVAPNGTIYIHANNIIYALSRTGALLWVQMVNSWPYVPPSAGPDGAVYVGSINTVYRIGPSGQIDWTVGGQEIGGTPTVGPDGVLYGAFEVQPGAFAVDCATGQYEWTNDPALYNWGEPGNEIRFGRPGPGQPIDRFYVSWDAIWAFSLSGDHLFTTSAANVLSHEPAIGSDGTIYIPRANSAYLAAYGPDDGSLLWQTNSDWLAHISAIEIGADDTLYFVSDSTSVNAYDPHTQSSIWQTDVELYLDRPTLSPDGETLVVSGGGSQGQAPFVKGFNTTNGHELWHVAVQDEWDPNFRIVPWHHTRMSADSATAYMPSFTLQWPIPDGDPRAFLYAIEVGEEAPIPGDLDGNGTVNFADVLSLIADWGPCPANCNLACDADLNGDCTVGFADILILLANWS